MKLGREVILLEGLAINFAIVGGLKAMPALAEKQPAPINYQLNRSPSIWGIVADAPNDGLPAYGVPLLPDAATSPADDPGTRQSTSMPMTQGAVAPATGLDAKLPVLPEIKPADRPAPPGMAAAVKIFNAKKWSQAQKLFQGFIKDGTADVDTHYKLAYCLYNQRQYSKAQAQFEWVAKYATNNVFLQRSAESTARTISCHRSGICPQNCLKANDPRWQSLADHPGSLWIKFYDSHGGNPNHYEAFSQNHIGDIIQYENGMARDAGVCPTCGGTTRVAILRDGDPPPK